MFFDVYLESDYSSAKGRFSNRNHFDRRHSTSADNIVRFVTVTRICFFQCVSFSLLFNEMETLKAIFRIEHAYVKVLPTAFLFPFFTFNRRDKRLNKTKHTFR